MKKRVVWVASLCFAGILAVGALLFWQGNVRRGAAAYARGETPARFLLLGMDQVGQNTDVLLLLQIDTASGEGQVLQIPRDTYVCTGASRGRINQLCRREGGAEEVCALFEKAFGLPIDGYFCLSLSAVEELVNRLGGVTVNLPQAMDYEDPDQGLVIHLSAGVQRLDGAQTLGALRFRAGYAEGDLTRLKMQQRVMRALWQQVRQVRTLPEILAIYEGIRPNLLTNLSKKDIMVLFGTLFPLRETLHFSFMALPGGACREEESGAWYYVPCRAATEKLLRARFALPQQARFDANGFFAGTGEEMRNIYEDRYLDYTVFVSEEKKTE